MFFFIRFLFTFIESVIRVELLKIIVKFLVHSLSHLLHLFEVVLLGYWPQVAVKVTHCVLI